MDPLEMGRFDARVYLLVLPDIIHGRAIFVHCDQPKALFRPLRILGAADVGHLAVLPFLFLSELCKNLPRCTHKLDLLTSAVPHSP